MCHSYITLLAVSTAYKTEHLERCAGSFELLRGYWQMQKFFSDVFSCVNLVQTVNGVDPFSRLKGQCYEINYEYEQAI